MKKPLLAAAISATLCAAGAARAADESIPTITVTEDPALLGVNVESVGPGDTAASPDTADWLRNMPGANVNANGPLSGIVQYRGLFGDRVKVLLDGVETVAGCSNSMDPALHYTAPGLIEALEATRGIVPVSFATETLGGFVRAVPKNRGFGNDKTFDFRGEIVASGQTVDSGLSGAALLAAVNRDYRIAINASADQGDDYEYPEGKVLATEYQRSSVQAEVAHQGQHDWTLSAERAKSKDTGTPALPMDIESSDADIYKAAYATEIGTGRLSANLGVMDVTHIMTNYHLRTAPPSPAMWRSSTGTAEGLNADLAYAWNSLGGELTLGAALVNKRNDAVISNPNNASFFIDAFNDNDRDIASLFGEWDGRLSSTWSANLGLRYNQVKMDAGEVDGTPAMTSPAARSLRDEFNAADRSKADDNIDAAANFRYAASDQATVIIGLGHKTRSPSYQERYIWIPLQATGGLADGNNYRGNIELKPEQATQVELGLEWNSERFAITPRIFYHRIDDYIQGVPDTDQRAIMVSSMMGDPTPLRYANVEAELYGIDFDWRLGITPAWRLEGSLSSVTGKRRDIDDYLYRVAPPNARTSLVYDRKAWAVTLENVAYAKQDQVSESNGETETDSYMLWNLAARYDFNANGSIRAGVSNLTDELYNDHLAGVNRVRGSDVGVGERLPGRGRSAFANLNWRW